MTDLTSSARDIASAVRAGSPTASEVVAAHLDRIAEVNPRVNAAAVVLDDQARAAAEALDARIAAGEEPGPLAGVPISVKENIDLTWSATTNGLTWATDAVPAENATFLQRLLDAGAIPVARGNMPDFGFRWDTDNDLYGRTLNPWDPSRIPMGSSGGDAVMVATGMATAGIGNDYGGSLRLPALAAGIAALRPTTGRIPSHTRSAVPMSMTEQLYATNGPLARRVDDLDLLFGVMHGADDADPLSVTAVHPAAYDGPRRAAVCLDPAGQGVDPVVARSITRAAEALVAAGWDVTEAEPPSVARATELWEQLAYAEVIDLFQPGGLPGPLSEGSRYWYTLVNREVPLLDSTKAYSDGWAERLVIAAAWRRFLSEHAVLLGPVSAGSVPAIGFDVSSHDAAREMVRNHRLTVTASLLGLPAAAVPTGVEDGAPQSVQIIASSFRDHVALAAARDVEAALGASTPIDPRP